MTANTALAYRRAVKIAQCFISHMTTAPLVLHYNIPNFVTIAFCEIVLLKILCMHVCTKWSSLLSDALPSVSPSSRLLVSQVSVGNGNVEM